MKRIQFINRLFIITAIFYCQFSFGQNEKSESDSISEYDYWNYGMTFTVQAGIWKPLGNLNNIFSTNPNIGLRFGFPITKTFRLELGTSINFPINSETFAYTAKDTSFNAHSVNTVNGVLGLWVSHEKRIKENLFFDKYFGFGIGFIQTGVEKLNPKSDNDNYYSVETINLNIGIGLRKIVFRKRSIGVFIEYNFAPFPLFETVDNDFGNSYLITGMSYRF